MSIITCDKMLFCVVISPMIAEMCHSFTLHHQSALVRKNSVREHLVRKHSVRKHSVRKHSVRKHSVRKRVKGQCKNS